MNTLIAFACVGAPAYLEMAKLCIASLRGSGRYRGDIALLTDQAWPGARGRGEKDDGVRVVRVPLPATLGEIFMLKYRLDEFMDVSAYERILLLDVDIIAIDDVQPLFDFCSAGLSASEELGYNALATDPMGDCLTAEEIESGKGRWAVNAGSICFEGTIAKESLALLRRSIAEYLPRANRFFDQPVLNALIVRGQLPFSPYPAHWIDFPSHYRLRGKETVIAEETKLLHFCGAEKLECLTEMQLSESLIASVRRGETDAVRRHRLAWLHDIIAAKDFQTDQASRWQAEAAFQAQQSKNWETEAKYQAQQSTNWRTEAEYQAQQSKNWQAEVQRLEQQIGSKRA